MHKHRKIWFHSFHEEDFVQDVVKGRELLRIFFNGGVVRPREHLIMLDYSLADRFAISFVFFLQVDQSLCHARDRRRLLRDLLNSDPMLLVLINLFPVRAAFLSAREACDWT